MTLSDRGQRLNKQISIEKTCSCCSVRFTDTMTALLGEFPVPVAHFKRAPSRCAGCRSKEAAERERARVRRQLGFADHEVIKAHFIAHPPKIGDLLILASFQFNRSCYQLTRVTAVDVGHQRRMVIEPPAAMGGSSFHRSGKSTFHPKGQTVLLPYVEAIARELEVGRETELTDAQLQQLLEPLQQG